MTKKIFIGYSTWSGATHEVADAIAKQLTDAGYQASVVDLKKADDPSDYDTYILGTSIHASHPNRSFIKFIKKYQPILSTKPTALFVVCANLFQDTPENRQETLTWLNDSLKDIPKISYLDIGLFGGATITESQDYEKLNPFAKMIIKSMKKSIVEKLGTEDFRDWEKIKTWADEIGKKLK